MTRTSPSGRLDLVVVPLVEADGEATASLARRRPGCAPGTTGAAGGGRRTRRRARPGSRPARGASASRAAPWWCSARRAGRAAEIQDGRSSARSKSSRTLLDRAGESGHGSSGRSRATSPTTGQPSTQVTGARKVSRPSTCQPGVPPRGRTPSSTIHQEPSGPWTRSAWPVFWMGWSVPRWVRIGLAGHGSNGPSGVRPRAIETPWPRSVPPSAMSRYQ